jgi:hypothetical protein
VEAEVDEGAAAAGCAAEDEDFAERATKAGFKSRGVEDVEAMLASCMSISPLG